MTHTLKIGALVFALVAWLLLSQALYAGPPPNHGTASFEVPTICVAAPWMPSVSFGRSALGELRERMARYGHPTGVCITGPFEQDSRAPETLEEAWLIERLYGPAQRWVLDIMPLHELSSVLPEAGEYFFLKEIYGLSVGILTSKVVSRLSVELCGEAIRVYELDA